MRVAHGRFAGKVALVTGGGTGIGQATALALAREGAQVVVAGRTTDPLVRTVKAIEETDGVASYAIVDVTVDDDVAHLVDLVVQRHGSLDVAVNNAGVPSWGRLADMDKDEWDPVIAVNLTGTWLCMKHEIKRMCEQGLGAIVNVSSRIGPHMRVTHQSAYASSKAAVSTLTRSAAREYISCGVRINAVSPGPTGTAMALWPGETPVERGRRVARDIPIGRMASPAEIAMAILWLASPEAGFVVGHDLVIDGGLSA